MKLKKLVTGAVSVFAVLGVAVLVAGNTASALAPATSSKAAALPVAHRRFQATGFQTFFNTNITTPPAPGQFFTLEEDLKNSRGAKIGTDHIECQVALVLPTGMQFNCTAKFFISGGSLNGTASFFFPFDPSQLPVRYDAEILGGTGIYTRAFGLVHVVDSGPGLPTQYDFDFVIL